MATDPESSHNFLSQPATIKWLSAQELDHQRAQDLYIKYYKQFMPVHRCKQLFWLELEEPFTADSSAEERSESQWNPP